MMSTDLEVFYGSVKITIGIVFDKIEKYTLYTLGHKNLLCFYCNSATYSLIFLTFFASFEREQFYLITR